MHEIMAGEGMATRLEALKKEFSSNCKIVENIGDCRYVINVKLDGAKIKFQLEDDCVSSPLNYVVCSEEISETEKSSLSNHLNIAFPVALPCHLSKIVHAAQQWLVNKRETPNDVTTDCTYGNNQENKKKTKQSPQKKRVLKSTKEETSTKLVFMKTSGNVISRILWDDDLPTEDFVVGYTDRFLGVVEKWFTAFSWEDIASVDYDTLCIPKHRIQYFKYRDVTVWDKNKRMDNFFGSTGSNITIVDVIERYDDFLGQQEKPLDEPEDDTCTTEDSDDDDVCIITEQGSDKLPAPQLYWGVKIRPTHFIAVRITNPDVLQEIKKAHDIITSIEPLYEECCIPATTQHVTVCCVGLDTGEQVQRCIASLHAMKPELESMKPNNIQMHFGNVADFFSTTLYSAIQPTPSLNSFVEHIKISLQNSGVDIRDVFEFVPHTTIMKYSRHLQVQCHSKYIDCRILESLSGRTFGCQGIDGVYLCKMSDERREDGFYVSPAHIQFSM